MKKWQITLGLAAALVLALGLGVAAFAQARTPAANVPLAAAPEAVVPEAVAPEAAVPQAASTPPCPGNGQGGGYGMRFGMNGESLVDVTARVTGLSTSEVVAELQAGRTFAQVAEAHGSSADELVSEFLAARKALLDQAVADGRITQEQADLMLQTMRTNVEQHVNSTWEPRGMGYRYTTQQTGTVQPRGPRWNP